jgi:hypothetical protein
MHGWRHLMQRQRKKLRRVQLFCAQWRQYLKLILTKTDSVVPTEKLTVIAAAIRSGLSPSGWNM